MSKKQKSIIAVIIFISIAIVFYSLAVIRQNQKIITFTGIITAEDINCLLADSPSIIYVDTKKVIIDPGHVQKRGAVGTASEDLQLCDAFLNTVPTNSRMGVPSKDQPNGGEELIGRTIEVHAAALEDGSFTLQGSNDYYAKVIAQ